MKLRIDKSFQKDVTKIQNASLNKRIIVLIDKLRNIKSISELSGIKKLEGHPNCFRIKSGDFRIGLILEKDEITLVRCLPRKDIYKYFP
jgi:mRNA interferase RelE/StbE